jgi:hypothetical protein
MASISSQRTMFDHDTTLRAPNHRKLRLAEMLDALVCEAR